MDAPRAAPGDRESATRLSRDVLGDVPLVLGLGPLTAVRILDRVLHVDRPEVQRHIFREPILAAGAAQRDMSHDDVLEVYRQELERLVARLADDELALLDVLAVQQCWNRVGLDLSIYLVMLKS